MKKFSFKKLATVSLFFTSVIFTSAFTTCFIPIVSTSHSSDQPNATKIDLNDYNNKTLPESIYKPDDPDMIEEILIGQLGNIGPIPPVGWENWECHPNQFDLEIKSSTDTGGSFTLTAKSNAVNYVGSSTATISFNYTDSSKTDISTIITNIQLTTDTNAFSVTPSSQQLLAQLKQVNQNARINSLVVDPSTAFWDKTHVIIGDETHSGSYKVTVSVKPNDPIYTGTVDVYYLVQRNQLNFSETINLPYIISRAENKWVFFKLNDIDKNKLDLGNYAFQYNTTNYLFTVSANPLYFDVDTTIVFNGILTDTSRYFTLSYDQLNNLSGWSGFISGSIRFYEIDTIHHYVSAIDENIVAASGVAVDISIHGVNAVFGDVVINPNDSSQQQWTLVFHAAPNNRDMGAFGGTVGGDMTKINCYSSFEGTVTLNPSLVTFTRNGFRLQRLMTGLIIPENGDLDYCESAGLMGAGVTELTIPEHISTIITSFISEFQTMDENHNIQKITIEGDNFRPLFPEKTGSVGWFRNGTGKGRLYVKNEALRQRYINDSEWRGYLVPKDGDYESMVQLIP